MRASQVTSAAPYADGFDMAPQQLLPACTCVHTYIVKLRTRFTIQPHLEQVRTLVLDMVPHQLWQRDILGVCLRLLLRAQAQREEPVLLCDARAADMMADVACLMAVAGADRKRQGVVDMNVHSLVARPECLNFFRQRAVHGH